METGGYLDHVAYFFYSRLVLVGRRAWLGGWEIKMLLLEHCGWGRVFGVMSVSVLC